MDIPVNRIGLLASILILAIFQAAFLYHDSLARSASAIDVRVDKLPMVLGEWTGRDGGELDPRSKDTLQLSHYVRRYYSHPSGKQLYVYIGYWNKQTGDHQAAKHSPSLCLPANGWVISIPHEKHIEASRASLNRSFEASSLLAQTRGVTQFFTYWFFSGEKIYREESHALLNMTREILLHGRSDGGIIEISTAVRTAANKAEAEAEAESTVDLFLKDFLPAVQKIIDEPSIHPVERL